MALTPGTCEVCGYNAIHISPIRSDDSAPKACAPCAFKIRDELLRSIVERQKKEEQAEEAYFAAAMEILDNLEGV